LTTEEKTLLKKWGVAEAPVDTYEDFTGTADFLQTLDLTIGISTLPTELAAAIGVTTWFLCHDPLMYQLRKKQGPGNEDRLSLNSHLIFPTDVDYRELRADVLRDTILATRDELMALVSGQNHR
jgi:hypothetical protein